ncbi:MAG: sulfatase-like hydrolase/transferase, partial [Phycisphaerales bacterium]|nr:sulfatase-like hydrolase/transferase [Phycisphaerales bacterium]
MLFVVVDTLRADAIARADTPVLDGLGARGEIVPTAWASGTWTVPSMISMFTGMPVRQHGWNREPGNVEQFPKIPPAPTLAEVLARKGFHTTALYANDFLDPDLGYSRGFETYRKSI